MPPDKRVDPESIDLDDLRERIESAYGSLRQCSMEWGYDESTVGKIVRGEQPVREIHLVALRAKERERDEDDARS